jgi:serine/threonine protein kinase
MWSLGCVYLEIIVWFTEGYEALRTFRDSRETEVTPHGLVDEGFYYDDGSGILQLRDPVVKKIEYLSQSCEGGLKDIVDTIPSLLKIDPKDRLTASQLVQKLRHMGTGDIKSSSAGLTPGLTASLPVRTLSAAQLPAHDSDSDSDFGGMVKITGPTES